jgi:hypothetical protein
MSHRTVISLAASAILGMACVSTALAKDAGPPKLDIDNICHATASAVATSIGETRDMVGPCLDDEKTALEELKKNWATYAASGKAQCIQPKEYVPGYVEWITCLDMDAAVKVSRKGQPLIGSSDTHECPVVRFEQNGTIVSVQTRC